MMRPGEYHKKMRNEFFKGLLLLGIRFLVLIAVLAACIWMPRVAEVIAAAIQR